MARRDLRPTNPNDLRSDVVAGRLTTSVPVRDADGVVGTVHVELDADMNLVITWDGPTLAGYRAWSTT